MSKGGIRIINMRPSLKSGDSSVNAISLGFTKLIDIAIFTINGVVPEREAWQPLLAKSWVANYL